MYMMDDILPPQAKRVRRDELYADSEPSSDSGASEGEQARLATQLRQQLGSSVTFSAAVPELSRPLDKLESTRAPGSTADETDQPEPQAYSFRLFSSSKPNPPSLPNSTGAPQDNAAHEVSLTIKPNTIILSHDLEDSYLLPSRPNSYYFANPPTASQAASFRAAALTTADVFARAAWARTHWLADQRPRRVLHLQLTTKAARRLALRSIASMCTADDDVGAIEATETESLGRRRCRRSKKMRIRLRVRAAARTAKEDASRAAQEAKDAAVREKKTLMNRKKQQRKRAKAREASSAGVLVVEEAESLDPRSSV